jgi:putative Holliday junction resolvase
MNVVDLPVLLQDERLSTMAVERPMITQDLSRKKRKSRKDYLAASWILQTALDGLQKKR